MKTYEIKRMNVGGDWSDKPIIDIDTPYLDTPDTVRAWAQIAYDDEAILVRLWSEEYQSDLLEYCIELFHQDPMIAGFYVWQFANIRTSPDMDINRVRTFNNKGILDEYRNPKAAYFTIKKLTITLSCY